MSEPSVITVSTYAEAREVYRQKNLRQALYDAGDVVMADVLVNLHGAQHRDRRRLENRLFRKDTHARYERELLPPVVDATLAPYVADGHAELVSLSHQMMMNLAALAAGVDRPLGTPEETFHLYSYLMLFIEGATLGDFTGDRDAKRAEVAAALGAFDMEFLQPSIAARRAALARYEAGDIAEGDLPRDVLTILLRNHDNLELPSDVVLRETCFFLLAGAHTSATAFVRTLHNVFLLGGADGHGAEPIPNDVMYLQRCVHETIRLQPSSPVAMRWALGDLELGSGTRVREGDKVVIDLMAANRDRAVFGDDAERFDPTRPLPDGAAPWGLSFGLGMHACIGQDLAAGVDAMGQLPDEDHLYGLVAVAVGAVIAAGGTPDPQHPPQLDPNNTRGYWGTYPVVF
ncbi:MAG: cytochrome P450 [Acidimicrobiia bacterium]